MIADRSQAVSLVGDVICSAATRLRSSLTTIAIVKVNMLARSLSKCPMCDPKDQTETLEKQHMRKIAKKEGSCAVRSPQGCVLTGPGEHQAVLLVKTGKVALAVSTGDGNAAIDRRLSRMIQAQPTRIR